MKKFVAIALIMLGVGIVGALISFDWKNMNTFGTEPLLIEKTIPAASIKSININSSSVSTDVIRGTTNDIKVSIEGRASKKYLERFKLETKVDGDTVNIEGTFTEGFNFGINIVDVDMVVELPARLWDAVDIKSKSGNIEVESLQANLVTIKNSSGNVDADEVQAESVTIESGSGNVDTEQVQASSITIGNSSGNVKANDVSAKTISLQSKSGNVKAENYKAEQMTAKTSSGNINLDDGTGIVNGESSSGNIRIEAEELLHDVKLETKSGEVSISVEKEPQSAAVSFRTNSGGRSIKWKSYEVENDNDEIFSGVIGDGKIKIDVETSSGGLKLSSNN